jgi:tetratricopeptide (TPR) repeat protein
MTAVALLSRQLVILLLPALLLAQPPSGPELQRAAVRFYQSGRYKAAIPLYRQLTESNPSDTGLQKDFLILLWLDHRYADSVSVGKTLTAQAPDDFETWFIYARSLLASGSREEALAAFRRCQELQPGKKEIELAQGRLDGLLRHYDAALSRLRTLVQDHPRFKQAWPELAHLEQITHHYPQAAAAWAHAADFYPDRSGYAFHWAESLYYSGQKEAARDHLKKLIAADPPYWPAFDFLTDEALARGDRRSARELLETRLTALQPDDEGRLVKLAQLDLAEKRWKDLLNVCERWLSLNPYRASPWLLKANALREQGALAESIRTYKKIVELNPAESNAWLGMARAYDDARQPRNALKAVEKAQALDPTDPYLTLLRSFYLSESGETQAAQELLSATLHQSSGPVLPALLYHGLTPFEGDPILAYAMNRTTATFADHLQALQSAGYHTVTTEEVSTWLKDHAALPERPVLITFDDSRMDSLLYGDPILQRNGFSAAMFAALIDVEGYIPRAAVWNDLKHYQDTGRWEIQSHGDQAHQLIPTDPEGHRGLFLLNKQWLETRRGYESNDEWAQRARTDHFRGRKKIADRLQMPPHSYSFPEGDFGQIDIPNAPDSARLTLARAHDVFDTVWHQDDYGMNLRTRDPARLTRFEPPAGMTGASLVRHLSDDAPAVMMRRRLLRLSGVDNRWHEAFQRLNDLRTHGVSDLCLWSEEARLRVAHGDRTRALELVRQARREEDSPDTEELLEAIQHSPRWLWRPSFYYQEDNRNRVSRRFRQDFGTAHLAGIDLFLHHVAGSYSEAGIQTIEEQGGGLTLARNLGNYQRITLEATGHHLTLPAKNTYSLEGNLRSSWTDDWTTELSGGRRPYDTTRAMANNIIRNYVDGSVRGDPLGNWRASAQARGEFLSDNNTRATLILQGGRRILWPRFYLTGRVWLDNMDHLRPDYYSPQKLQTYQFGFDYKTVLTNRANVHLTYLPGYGKEERTDGEFVQDLDFEMDVFLTRTWTLTPSFVLTHTPSYHRQTTGLALTARF